MDPVGPAMNFSVSISDWEEGQRIFMVGGAWVRAGHEGWAGDRFCELGGFSC